MFGFSVILDASTKREVGRDEWNNVCESILILEYIIFVVMTRRLCLMIFWISCICVCMCLQMCICLCMFDVYTVTCACVYVVYKCMSMSRHFA